MPKLSSIKRIHSKIQEFGWWMFLQAFKKYTSHIQLPFTVQIVNWEKLAIHGNPAGSPREEIHRENKWKMEMCFFAPAKEKKKQWKPVSYWIQGGKERRKSWILENEPHPNFCVRKGGTFGEAVKREIILVIMGALGRIKSSLI